jgi:hypothetical protein
MIKMKKTVKFSVGIIFFLVVSNIPPMQTIFKLLFDQKLYYYSTKDGSALFDENIFLGRVFHFRRSTTNLLTKHNQMQTPSFTETSNQTLLPFGGIGTTFLMNDIHCHIFHWKKPEKRGRNGRKK